MKNSDSEIKFTRKRKSVNLTLLQFICENATANTNQNLSTVFGISKQFDAVSNSH